MPTLRSSLLPLALVLAMNSPYALSAPGAEPRAVHTVAAEETLDAIAARYHVTVRQLQYFNTLPDPEAVRVGQAIAIPPPGLRVPWDWQQALTPETHTVARGETLAGIARQHGVEAEALQRENGIADPDLIAVGLALRIPGTVAAVAPGSVVEPAAAQPEVAVTPVAEAVEEVEAPAEPAAEPAAEPVAEPAGVVHAVAEGETLEAIAARFHVTERQLRFHNLIPEPEVPAAGATLRIPEPTLRVPWNWQSDYAAGRLAGHEVAVHEVKRGETLALIARSYGLKMEELVVLNGLSDPNALTTGDLLRLPAGAEQRAPVEVPVARRAVVDQNTPLGIYVVARGDSLSLIANRFGVRLEQLKAINTLPNPDLLEVGDQLLVPDPMAVLPPVEPPSKYTFMWPLDDYRIVSEYGGRGGREHRGIDLAAPAGASVRASADGTVIFVGEQRGYGLVVVLDHGGGVETLYAHNTANLVRRGQNVLQGQRIATVGKTGNARGNHVHFEYIVGGDSKEPRDHIETELRAGA